MREAGFERLSVWVPTVRKPQFDKIVTDLQVEWEQAKLYPS